MNLEKLPNDKNASNFKIGPKEEIHGSKPKKLFLQNSYVGNLNVKDINENNQFKSKRLLNPLEPVYDIY